MAEARIGVGVIGCGAIGLEHASAYSRLARRDARIRLVALADEDVARAQLTATAAGWPRWTSDWQSLLREDALDAISVCVPTHRHRAVATYAAQQGVHVLVEKPLAVTLADAQTIVDECAISGVLLMAGHSGRFDPVNLELKRLVDDGSLGRPGLVRLSSHHGYFWPDGWDAWQIDPERSGGHIVHNGVHDLDLASWLFGGLPVRVLAVGTRLASAALDTFDAYSIHAVFTEGETLVGELSCGAVRRDLALRSVHVVGSTGVASYDSLNDGFVWNGIGFESPPLAYRGAVERELRHWVDCVRGAETVAVSGSEGLGILAVALAAETSAREGRVVEL